MRARLMLLMAIVLGLFTTLLFYQYIHRLEGGRADAPHTVGVVVAAKAIAKNEVITADMLTGVQVPDAAAFPGTFRDASAIVGKIANGGIAQGEPILAGHLTDAKEEADVVSRKIGDGMRGISVGVNFVQSVSNLIEPEDRVDVIAAIQNPDTKIVTTSLVLENVRVLAVGRRMVGIDKAHPYAEYSAATLEVGREDAVKLVDAAARGTLTLTLHSRLADEGTKVKEDTGHGS